jgi:hypothetical protein
MKSSARCCGLLKGQLWRLTLLTTATLSIPLLTAGCPQNGQPTAALPIIRINVTDPSIPSGFAVSTGANSVQVVNVDSGASNYRIMGTASSSGGVKSFNFVVNYNGQDVFQTQAPDNVLASNGTAPSDLQIATDKNGMPMVIANATAPIIVTATATNFQDVPTKFKATFALIDASKRGNPNADQHAQIVLVPTNLGQSLYSAKWDVPTRADITIQNIRHFQTPNSSLFPFELIGPNGTQGDCAIAGAHVELLGSTPVDSSQFPLLAKWFGPNGQPYVFQGCINSGNSQVQSVTLDIDYIFN